MDYKKKTATPKRDKKCPCKSFHKRRTENVADDPDVSANVLAEKLGVTEKTIKRGLQLLKPQNLIVRIGTGKNGYWKAI